LLALPQLLQPDSVTNSKRGFRATKIPDGEVEKIMRWKSGKGLAAQRKSLAKFSQFERTSRSMGVAGFFLLPILLPVFIVAIAVALAMSVSPHEILAAAKHFLHSPNALPLMGFAAAAPSIQPAAQSKANIQALLARATRDQGPEVEQALTWANGTGAQQFSTPTSLRTDRKVSLFALHVRGRITNGAGVVTYRTGPALLGTALFSLIQQITIRGQHVRYGAQSPLQMSGETAAEYMALVYPNYVPTFKVSVNGGALTSQGALGTAANATNDFDFVLPIPLFPPDLSGGDIPFYCLHGPDWPGNLFMDVKVADPTALGVTIASLANSGFVTAFGSATGTASIEINSERPLISKDFMSKIRPAVLFRITNSQQPTSALATTASGSKLADLVVGKDTTRVFLKVGTQLAATGAGITTFGSLSDTIVTRTFFSMDARALRFQGANGDSVLQDYLGRKYGRVIPAGYRIIEFVSTAGPSSANPKAAFSSSKLTAARKFELDGDVTGAANQIAEVVQEMLLGRPGLLS